MKEWNLMGGCEEDWIVVVGGSSAAQRGWLQWTGAKMEIRAEETAS